MPRNKVLEKAKVTMPSGRNAFDLSQVRNFTGMAGKIEVAYAQPFVAGTKGKISRKCFTRTAQIVSPALHQVTEHYDFFVVPIHSLWRQWENWKLNINDLQDTFSVPFYSAGSSSSYPTGSPDLRLPTNCPRLNFDSLIENLGYLTGTSFSVFSQDEKTRLTNDLLRLTDQLRYNQDVVQNSGSTSPYIDNVLMAAAYQKCYFDHYRRNDYEANNPYAYNLDWLYDGTHNGLLSPSVSAPTSKDCYVARELFKIRRVNYRNDYFMNIYPGLNYVVSQPTNQNWGIPSNVGQLGIVRVDQDANSIVRITQASSTQSTTATVQSIRAAFALDKLLRASAYAPKHVRDQYKALYGVEGVEDFDMRSERIGSFQSQVQFVEVTNMAETNTTQLGALGAKGVGGDDSKDFFNFYCKYDSIIIGLHYFLPRAVYDNYGVHPWNTKLAREDFYVKAFENLGLRPMYGNYLNYTYPSASSQILGWTVPNFEYKILPDLNFGEFRQSFVRARNIAGTVTLEITGGNELSTFVPHSGAALLDTTKGISAESFKAAPQDLDNMFAVSVDPAEPIGMFQFFGSMRIICMIVAPMSVHGQPSL